MTHRRRALGAPVFTALALIAGCAVTADPAPEALTGGNYALDPAHANVTWRVSHSGFSFYVGRFDQLDGTLRLDPNRPEAAQVEVRIDAASVSTGDAEFDKEIAEKVFEADDHPQIRFVSTAVTRRGEREALIDGALTMRGKTRPVRLEAAFIGSGATPFSRGREIVGFTATTTIDRTQWGADAWTAFGIGAEVEIRLDVEFQSEGKQR